MDFVLTFEELAGIIEAKDIDPAALEVDPNEIDLVHASGAGRGFAQSGGVAKAVADKIKEWHPDMEVKIASAQGLAECKKLLMLAKAGKYNGYLLEGMGCPGGCIGGAGTIADHPAEQVCQGSSVCGPRGEPVHEQHPHAERRSQLRGLSTCLSAASRLPGGGFFAATFSTFLTFYVESATVL